MPQYRRISLLLAALGLACVAPARAQTATPDAGALRQQIEQQRVLPLPPAAPPAPVAPVPEARPAVGATVTVRGFRFAGNKLVGTRVLQKAVAPFVGKALDFEGLQRTTDAVAAAYRKAGRLARVYLPEQDISEGTITLQVVEARFGGVRIEGKPAQRVRPPELQAFLMGPQVVGQPLDIRQVDRALLLSEDLPGLSVAGTLTAGQADGETALVVQASDEPVTQGEFTVDNMGSRATGSRRQMLNVNFNSPGGLGEVINLIALHTEGSDYGRLGLTFPHGYNGLRLGINTSSLVYRVRNSAAQLKGRSTSFGLDFSYPLRRARQSNVYLAGGGENKRFYNRNITQVASDYETNSLRLGLNANGFDDWLGGGASNGNLQMQWGQLAAVEAHSQKDTLRPHYRKLTYGLSRQQTVSSRHSVMFTLSGQHAVQPLDSSERFFIGGASSVRAYPSSELGGERGQVASIEWRWRVRPAWQVGAFADTGRVVSLPATATDTRTDLHLRGGGLNLTWQGPSGVTAKATWSRRIGSNPKPTPQGTDADGTLRMNRFWVSVNIAF